MLRFLAVTLLSCALLTAPAADLKSLSDDTRWFIHVDVVQLRDSTMGAWLKEAASNDNMGPKIDLLEAITGMRPLRDIDHVLISGPVFGDESQIVIHVEGRFDVAKLTTVIRAAKDYETNEYGSYTIHQWLDEDKRRPVYAASFAGNGIVMSANPNRLRRTLDTLSGDAPGLNQTDLFAADTFTQGAITLAAAAGIQQLGALPADATMLQHVDSLRVSLSEKNKDMFISAEMTAKNEDAGTQMIQLAQGMVALARLAKPEDLPPGAKQILDAVSLSQNGVSVEGSVKIPLDQIKRFIEAKKAGFFQNG